MTFVSEPLSSEWRNFKLQKVIPYNHNTSTFVFELPKNVPSGLTVASALVTKSFARDGEMACVDEKGKPVIRPYTVNIRSISMIPRFLPTGNICLSADGISTSLAGHASRSTGYSAS